MKSESTVDLILTPEDKRLINGKQVGQLLYASLRAVSFVGIFLFVYALLTLRFGEDVPFMMVVLSIVFTAYFELWPMMDLTKKPENSEFGYVVKMQLSGWEPVHRRRYGQTFCIAFQKDDQLIPWAFDDYLQSNVKEIVGDQEH